MKLAIFKITVAISLFASVFFVFWVMKPKPIKRIKTIEKQTYYYPEPNDWVNDSTVSVERRIVYDHLVKQ